MWWAAKCKCYSDCQPELNYKFVKMEDDKKQTFKGNLQTCFGYIVGTVVIILGASFFINKDKNEYMGMFYSTDEPRSVYEFKKGFKTLDKCREWARELAEDNDLSEGDWDYDCGIGCMLSSDSYSPSVTTYDCATLEK